MGGAIRILIAGLVGVILGLISWSETGPLTSSRSVMSSVSMCVRPPGCRWPRHAADGETRGGGKGDA